jgi:hypothetical protein
MRKSIVAPATIALVLCIGAPAGHAAAIPLASPGQLGVATELANSVEKTALICGPWGCTWRPWGWYRPYPYWGWRRHYWWGWQRPWGDPWSRPWGWRRW